MPIKSDTKECRRNLTFVLEDRCQFVTDEVASILATMVKMNDACIMELAWHADRLSRQERNRRRNVISAAAIRRLKYFGFEREVSTVEVEAV